MNTAQKITIGIAAIASLLGCILMATIGIMGEDTIVSAYKNQEGLGLTIQNIFIYLVLAMFVIAVLYFIITGIISLITNPSALKKDALPLVVLVVIGILLLWISNLDANVFTKASFINAEDTRLTEYYGLSSDQLSSISSWKSWLTAGLGTTVLLLVVATLAFVYDLVKSVFK